MKVLLYLTGLLYFSFAYAADELKPLSFKGIEFTTGRPIQLSKFKGNIVYMDFWASWCAPCIESMPFMEKIHHRFADDKFKIIAINIDKNKSDAEDFLKKYPVSFLNLYDPNGKIGKQLKVKDMPTAFVIDSDGKVLFKHSGFNQQYAIKLEKLLSHIIK